MNVNAPKPWMKKPGELHDRKGVPVYPGDLIRTPHFRERRRQHYLYHTAVYTDGAMRMVSTSKLEPTMKTDGYGYLMNQECLAESEVISGHGPGEYLDFRDRPKVKLAQ